MVFCAAAILAACTAQGAVYYVSKSSNAPPVSRRVPRGPQPRVRSYLQPGDSVLFAIMRGRLHPQSGGPGAQITYGAYGGPKP